MMLQTIILLLVVIFWFVLDTWFEQRLNSSRLIRILRNQEDGRTGSQSAWELVPPPRAEGAPRPARPHR
jgi:hypothetical protein